MLRKIIKPVFDKKFIQYFVLSYFARLNNAESPTKCQISFNYVRWHLLDCLILVCVVIVQF